MIGVFCLFLIVKKKNQKKKKFGLVWFGFILFHFWNDLALVQKSKKETNMLLFLLICHGSHKNPLLRLFYS